jgi:hypothetical protein
VGNFVPGLEHGDRICEVDIFDIPSSQLEKCFSRDAAAISGADKLLVGSNDEMAPISPNVFLIGDVCNNVARELSI